MEASGQNPSCGDEVTLQLKFDGDKISEVGVLSHGCAISTSSGSMLAELMTGISIMEAEQLAAVFKQVLRGEEAPTEVDLGDLEALAGVRKFPLRIKCALLPWITLIDAVLAHKQGRAPEPVNTDGITEHGEPMDVTIKQENDRERYA